MPATAANIEPQTAKACLPRKKSWEVRELVLIGVFSVTIKVSTMAVALAGGGMNPVTLLLKNCLFTTLLVVLLAKVRKSGSLLLFTAVNLVVSLLLMGGSVTLLAPLLLAALFAEWGTHLCGGLERSWGPFVAVGLYDCSAKALSIAILWLFSRENPALLYVVGPFVAFGYLGSIAGLYVGYKALKELRHAGLAAR